MLPLVVFVIMTLLMIQLGDAKAMVLTLLTAPLGLIGVIFALIISSRPLGFVAELGVVALSGMIIRNSVILIDQIQQHVAAGENLHDAIIDSAVLRFRPIMWTAAADRKNLSALKNLPVYLGAAGYVPLEQLAKISFDAEYGLIVRRDLKPTITVQANILSGTANDATKKAFDATEDLRKNLPLGYSIEPGGDLEQSKKSTGHLAKMLPLMASVFWAPMAVAIAGGLLVATVLTLLVLPVMYAAVYRSTS